MPTGPRGDDPEVRRQVLDDLVKKGAGLKVPRPLRNRMREPRTLPEKKDTK